ncbi:hypothetical protein J2W76_003460 [Methylorubrum zatmanii]|nr:hypothetical protein [Methylorubrum zatmanii]MCP1553171.1 hypothetical protein [Methylorubrum extorquens]MCP1580517.1 hypothetical protein [Methylorubrum extorquens]
MSNPSPALKLSPAAIEAANRAEASALLIRCGYRVYRPEADIQGEDLVLRTPEGGLHGVQLQSRPMVDWRRYGARELLMLFPADPFTPDAPRPWFLVPHDTLYSWVKERHGAARGWAEAWSYPSRQPGSARVPCASPRATAGRARDTHGAWFAVGGADPAHPSGLARAEKRSRAVRRSAGSPSQGRR